MPLPQCSDSAQRHTAVAVLFFANKRPTWAVWLVAGPAIFNDVGKAEIADMGR
jgi:hypothetical protein